MKWRGPVLTLTGDEALRFLYGNHWKEVRAVAKSGFKTPKPGAMGKPMKVPGAVPPIKNTMKPPKMPRGGSVKGGY